MVPFLIKRLFGAAFTLLILLSLTFFLLRAAPGGPFDTDRVWPPEIQANILRRYELDRPVSVQFAHWLRDLSRGDLRESFQYLGHPVKEILVDALPVSMSLGLLALALSILAGIPLGCLAAWKRNTWLDGVAMFSAVAGVSLPSYLVASLLILIFSLGLGWFPPALWEGPSSVVLPVITLALRPIAMVARLTRASMIEALQADYVRTARGKGLAEPAVVLKHALRNSLIPVLTILGPIAANLVTGSFLVEVVFQIPGIGKHFVQGVLNRDYPLVMGVTLIYGVVLIGSNLAVDALYGLIDPRIRVET
jgi:oligopeptide transport system permease protein